MSHGWEIDDPVDVLDLWNSLLSVCRETQLVPQQPRQRTALAYFDRLLGLLDDRRFGVRGPW